MTDGYVPADSDRDLSARNALSSGLAGRSSSVAPQASGGIILSERNRVSIGRRFRFRLAKF